MALVRPCCGLPSFRPGTLSRGLSENPPTAPIPPQDCRGEDVLVLGRERGRLIRSPISFLRVHRTNFKMWQGGGDRWLCKPLLFVLQRFPGTYLTRVVRVLLAFGASSSSTLGYLVLFFPVGVAASVGRRPLPVRLAAPGPNTVRH